MKESSSKTILKKIKHADVRFNFYVSSKHIETCNIDIIVHRDVIEQTVTIFIIQNTTKSDGHNFIVGVLSIDTTSDKRAFMINPFSQTVEGK